MSTKGNKQLKTIANCTPREFLTQTQKILPLLEKYIKNLQEYTSKEDISDAGLATLLEVFCNNMDDTMAICGGLCFMSGDEFEKLDPGKGDPDGIAAVAEVLKSDRWKGFFTGD